MFLAQDDATCHEDLRLRIIDEEHRRKNWRKVVTILIGLDRSVLFRNICEENEIRNALLDRILIEEHEIDSLLLPVGKYSAASQLPSLHRRDAQGLGRPRKTVAYL